MQRYLPDMEERLMGLSFELILHAEKLSQGITNLGWLKSFKVDFAFITAVFALSETEAVVLDYGLRDLSSFSY